MRPTVPFYSVSLIGKASVEEDGEEAPHVFYQRLVNLTGAGGSPSAEAISEAPTAVDSDYEESAEGSEWAGARERQQARLALITDSQHRDHQQPFHPEAMPSQRRKPARATRYEQRSGIRHVQASSISATNIGFQVRALGKRDSVMVTP